MNKQLTALCAIALVSLWPGPASAASCTARSAPTRAVLLELYTSEGCDSCPPADQWLSRLRTAAPANVVPLAFHVDYWDRLGWVDRFASPAYSERQNRLAALAKTDFVYTPQFVRNGRDWRRTGSLAETAAAGASIALDLAAPASGPWQLDIDIQSLGAKPTAATWLALYEHNLESQVKAGENSGKTLHHDYVVRRLLGPFALDQTGRLTLHQAIALESGWKRGDLGMAAFVQDGATGEILQALARHACPG